MSSSVMRLANIEAVCLTTLSVPGDQGRLFWQVGELGKTFRKNESSCSEIQT